MRVRRIRKRVQELTEKSWLKRDDGNANSDDAN